MPRQQTLVQLTDTLVAALDERAARIGTSRSHLIREAVEAYLATDREAAIDAEILAGYERVPADEPDAWLLAAGRRSVQAEPW